jgi:(p)ppGpp synthase/HD superfamily hydrolase
MIDKAIKLAADVHEGQVDKGGEPYILHAIEVMQICKKNYQGTFNNDIVLCAAILHDVVEDYGYNSPWSKSRLQDYIYGTFGDRVYSAVMRLTREDHESYDEYIDRVSEDWIAREVKIADLTHNMDVTRLPEGEIGEVDFKRWDKYRRALIKLKKENSKP